MTYGSLSTIAIDDLMALIQVLVLFFSPFTRGVQRGDDGDQV